MRLQSILRRVQPLPRFVYGRATLRQTRAGLRLEVEVAPRAGAKTVCGGCGKKRRGYVTVSLET
jgi:hypothetical protein